MLGSLVNTCDQPVAGSSSARLNWSRMPVVGNSIGGSDGEALVLGEIEADGEIEGLTDSDGEIDAEGLTDELVLDDGELEAEGETDGEVDDDGVGDCELLGETDGLTLTEGDWEAEGDTEGDVDDEGDNEALGETDGETLGEPAKTDETPIISNKPTNVGNALLSVNDAEAVEPAASKI